MNNWGIQNHNHRYEGSTHFNANPNQFYSQYNQDRSLENCIFKGHKYAEFLCNVGYTEMLSGLKTEYDIRHINRIQNETLRMGGENKIILVKTQTIETICTENNIDHINYLSIDVEGGEMKVIKSINFDKVFIDVIAFENNYHDTQHIPTDYLKSKGYIKLPDHAADVFMIHKDSQFYTL